MRLLCYQKFSLRKSQIASEVASDLMADFIQNNVGIEYLLNRSIAYNKGSLKDFPKLEYGAQRAAKERQCLPI